MICVIMLIISIYGISATCADMLLSILLKSKKMKYQNDNLFVTRTFASKARTMSFTFGTLSMLILLSLLCLNFSSIYKGLYQTSIELTSPYDVEVFDWTQPFDDYKEYLDVIDEDYTIKETIEYNVYKEPKHQIQDYYDVQFYDYDPVMKLSDYNRLLKLRNMNTVELTEDEYFLVTDSQLLYKVEDNADMQTIQFANNELRLKGIDTKSFWYSMNNTGRFTVIVPDEYVQGLEISEEHLIVDTKEETTAKLKEKIDTELKHLLVVEDEDGTTHNEYYRVSVRGTVIEEQNTMTAIMASICLYIAFILISAVGTILAVQSLSDATKYKYRYQTLRRLGVNDKSLFKTIKKQLLILFGIPVVYSVIASFCMLASLNNVYNVLLANEFIYLFYFAGGLAIFFFIYGIYWIATYIGFKRNINEES
jgi:putative ABC transport system permease protein